MSAAEFSTETGLNRISIKRLIEGSEHPLKQIHQKLTQYHSMNRGMLQQRWNLLHEIVVLCTDYSGTKPPAKQASRKMRAVSKVHTKAAMRAALESQRASGLGGRMATPTQHVNVGSGHGPSLRFERVIKPGTMGMRGDDLAEMAREMGVELTGDDNLDFYALKKILKLVRTTQAEKLMLIYFSAVDRAQYKLDFAVARAVVLDSTGALFDTRQNAGGIPEYTAMYAADLAGNFFAKNYEDTTENRGTFHHSSFLAGDTALCAGTLKVRKGRIREISNMSGHYSPKLVHLVNACKAILNNGYDISKNFRPYALLADYNSELGPSKTSHFRIPLKTFVDNNGKPGNYLDFEVKPCGKDGIFHYTDSGKARARGCNPPD